MLGFEARQFAAAEPFGSQGLVGLLGMLKIHQIIFHASLDPSISITGTIIAILPVHIHILILNNVSMKPTGGMMNCKDCHLGKERNVDPFTKTSRSSNMSEIDQHTVEGQNPAPVDDQPKPAPVGIL